MRILATIPQLEPPADRPSRPQVPHEVHQPAGEPGRKSVTPAPRADRRIRRDPKPAFPLGSIAALLALAAVAWTLAGWNDARRTGRQAEQQAGQRIAEQPAAVEEPVTR